MSSTTSDLESMTDSIPPLTTDDSLSGSSVSVANGEPKLLYHYTDYGQVRDVASVSDLSPTNGSSTTEASIRAQKFPVKLYAILSQKEFQHIISWLPHGRSWKVLKPNLFQNVVMPLYFEYSNYHSFNRLVNAWSFRKITTGKCKGSYYHELFLRGKPNLQSHMRRLPKTQRKVPMKKSHEPDFYALDEKSPLPPLEEHSGSYPGYGGSPSPSPYIQQQFSPHLISPPVPYTAPVASTQSFTSDLLAIFDESNLYGDSMNPACPQLLPMNSPCQYMDGAPSYAGRGMITSSMHLSPTPLATESFYRLQQQQQDQEHQHRQEQQQHYLQQLQQIRSSTILDFGGAFEPQDASYLFASSQQNQYYDR